MTKPMPFKIRITPEGKYFDDEMYTHMPEDVLYVKLGDHPIETALQILKEQGCEILIQAKIPPDNP